MRSVAASGVALALGLLTPPGPAAAPGPSAGAPDPERVPDVVFTLDSDAEVTEVRLGDLGDGPYVVVPIFTRCRAVCSLVGKTLGAAWGDEGPEGASAPVLLVSFDPEDTPEDMARFRRLFELPASWHMATVEREQGLELFAALGFRWRTLSARQFDHSGKIFVLTGDRRVAAVLGPDQLTRDRLAAEVTAAATGASFARRVGTHWVGFFGVGVVLLTLVVTVAWDRVRSRRAWRRGRLDEGAVHR